MKLTKENWLEIAKDFQAIGGKALAEKYNVSTATINAIVTKMRKAGIHIPKYNNSASIEFIEYVKQNLAR